VEMGIHTLEILKIINFKVKGFTFLALELFIKDNLKIMSKMEMEKTFSPMEISIKEILLII